MPRLSKIGAASLAAFGFSSGAAGVTASYLVVAGGAGGGYLDGGGGGAGGYQASTTTLVLTTSYTVTVGAGGTGAPSNAADATNGSNSSFGTLTASVGGGFGGGNNTAGGYGGTRFRGAPGGSGGGGGPGNVSAALGTSGQGNNGGVGTGSYDAGGGGGGAGAVGSNGVNAVGGAGGNGTASSISGTSVTYAGGGGAGSSYTGSAGAGGTGGGGSGTNSASTGGAGTANLGSGGGGGGYNGSAGGAGGAGGSGIVIISYTGAQQFGGGVITTDGTNTIHTFTTSGVLSPISSLSASYLIVAGGGAGGAYRGGGGGAGGLLTSSVTIDTNSTYTVTVGAGGISTLADVAGGNGTNSTFSAVATAAVGGGGGGGEQAGSTGANGGSGGGGGTTTSGTSPAGTGTSGQGNNGGAGTTGSPYNGGGGGGAGAVGTAGSGSVAGAGGAGSASSITGSSVTYAGGGGGGSFNGTAASGGSGGGGAGSSSGAGTAGAVNTGSGGGGSGGNTGIGGAGGSGIVIISYAGATQSMAGGTVTIVGGNVIHTFTSSGYLTPLTLVGNSLRFRLSGPAKLTRTPTVSSSTLTKITYSAWIKRGKLTSYQSIYGGYIPTGPTNDCVRFNSSDQIEFNIVGGSVGYLATTAVYRDPAAWYHIVAALDTTQAVANDRMKLWVNGVQVPNTPSPSPSQNYNLTGWNNVGKVQNLGTDTDGSSFPFDGYMAEVRSIDGQALTPNSFGTFNSYGVWQPINYGGSYGTNGFYLPFTNATSTTTLGYDFSPQGNNWTTNNISVTAGATYDSMTDVPTLTSATAANYAVLNPLDSTLTLINANLSWSAPSNTERGSRATIGVSSGKWYYEYKITSATANPFSLIGWASQSQNNNSTIATGTGSSTWAYYAYDFKTYNNGTASSVYGVTGSVNDIIMVALDLDNSKIYWGRSGTWFNSGNPATQTNPAYSSVSGTLFPWIQEYNQTSSANFGQQPFSYTPPSGFVALNTYNL